MSPMIKLCGMFRPEDIQAVNRIRPDWFGLVINYPKSHRSLTPDQARALRREAGLWSIPVGVFMDQPVETVAALLNDGTVSIAQLHGHEDDGYIAALRRAAPDRPVWKAFRVRSRADLVAAEASAASLILLDSGAGTGRTFDWSLLEGFRRPYLLAGGLTPENLPEALERLRPFGVDLSSGVETDGRKDPEKMRAAVEAVRNG